MNSRCAGFDSPGPPHIAAYFNRGIVAAQWVSRRLHITDKDFETAAAKKLTEVIDTPGDALRDYLTGPLGARLFALLGDAAADGRHIYAALYELNDPQLETALEKLGQHAHVVLANGSVKHVGEDQNKAARDLLRDKIDLHDRMVSPHALGHNKFLVICDDSDKPRWVWTGSQNWSDTGLCTQANNSLLIDDATFSDPIPPTVGVAEDRWEHDAGRSEEGQQHAAQGNNRAGTGDAVVHPHGGLRRSQ